jgi:methylenetetrahydrofolate reductase (NADPH)
MNAGPDYAVSQMFFDSHYFFSFRERIEKRGITIPVLPGIMPITNFKKVKKCASFCGATIPPWIEEKMLPLVDQPEEMEKMGVDSAVRQCEGFLDEGVSYLHFYTMNRFEAVTQILQAPNGRFSPEFFSIDLPFPFGRDLRAERTTS